jgi:WD40 repeat protein
MRHHFLNRITCLGLFVLFLSACSSQSVPLQITNLPPITSQNTSSLAALKMMRVAGDGIASIAMNPDGSLLAFGTYDDSLVHLVDVSTGEMVLSLEGHTNTVDHLAFSPDGRMLASTGTAGLEPKDGSVRIWEVETGKQLAVFETSGINQVAFNPDGTLLAGAGLGEAKIILWDMQTLTEKTTLNGVSRAVAFSPTGNLLASGSKDNLVHILDLRTSIEIMTLSGHQGWVGCIAFSPTGELLASGADDQTLILWDTTTSQKPRFLTGHKSEIGFVSFSPDGSLLASLGSGIVVNRVGNQVTLNMSSEDKVVRLWNVQTGDQIKQIEAPDGVSSVAFNAAWTLIAIGDSTGGIQVWGVKP